MADGSGGRDGGLAPELAVRGTGPAAVTIAGLTAGGGALLVFVSEHCPTSALALRRLGPLCQAWARAGLTAVAIFEDPLDVAIRTARRLGWTGQVAADDPPYPASRAYRVGTVPTAVLVGRDGVLARTVPGWDQPALTGLLGEAGEMVGAGLDLPPATEPLRKPGCSAKAAIDPELAAAMSGPGGGDEPEEMFERGWTDGLPVIPPTAERVEAMLAGQTAVNPSAWSRRPWARPRWSEWPPAPSWPAAARRTSPWWPRPRGPCSIPRSTCTARR